jgi:activator of HSP90 ATPase
MDQEEKIRRWNFTSKGLLLIACASSCIIFVQPALSAQARSSSAGKAISNYASNNNIIIHQEIDFKAAPRQLYQTLLSSKEFSACIKMSFPNFTEMSATIDSTVGGAFSLFDGHIIGRILELVPSERIVEAWRVVDWPAGVYSIVKFELTPQNSGTHLKFDHIGFPEGLKEHLAEGWQQHYWDALAKYFH